MSTKGWTAGEKRLYKELYRDARRYGASPKEARSTLRRIKKAFRSK